MSCVDNYVSMSVSRMKARLRLYLWCDNSEQHRSAHEIA